tara:strand:- start:403 stop:639 length:237 start_codon:yes stop_codon:yes gene_type:complete
MIVIPIQGLTLDDGRLYSKAVRIPALMSAGSTGLHSNAIFFHGMLLLQAYAKGLSKDRRDYRVRSFDGRGIIDKLIYQ